MFFTLHKKAKIYLDYAASTPVSKAVLRAMRPYWSERFFNPKASYQRARMLREEIHKQEQSLHEILQMRADDSICWTGGGTESNELAIDHALLRWRKNNPGRPCQVLLSPLEHPSVYDYLSQMGDTLVEIVFMPVNERGYVQITKIDEIVTDWSRVALVACVLQSSEVGTTQPIKKIVQHIAKHTRELEHAPHVHVDAAQGVYYNKLNFLSWGADTVSLCSHKVEGPKGIGLLLCSKQTVIEKKGTPAVPLIMGASLALIQAQRQRELHAQLIQRLREEFFTVLDQNNIEYQINGAREERSLVINISFPGEERDSEELLVACDQRGLELSSKSACVGSQQEDSRILTAIGVNVSNSLRISLHHTLAIKTVREAAHRLVEVIKTGS